MDGSLSEAAVVDHPNILHLYKGSTFTHNDRHYVLISMVDLNIVLAQEIGTDLRVTIKLGDEKPLLPIGSISSKSTLEYDLLNVTPEQWAKANERLDIIRPLLETKSDRPKSDYQTAAHRAGISVPTLYRWIADYRESGRLTALIPAKRPGGRGKGRVGEDVEAIMAAVIGEEYLTEQRLSIEETVAEIRRRCYNAKLRPPARMTVINRLRWLDNRVKVEKRHGPYAAQMQLDPIAESLHDAQWPLALVMMDHTQINCMVVHETLRLPITRPWLTLAIDANTRVVVGMYLSLDEPSALSVGACLSHAILPKEKWLRDVGVDVEWKIWGDIENVHTDNAMEFRGYFLKDVCREYGMHAYKRPVKKPHYGHYIERMMGTLSRKLEAVPGTTFANNQEKGVYNPEKEAVMSFRDMEKWLAITIAQYHNTVHRELGTAPIEAWRDAMLGRNGKLPRGVPSVRLDEEKVRIDFLPFEERAITPMGIQWDVFYYHDVLRPWINATVPRKGSRLFKIRRDPRDISRVYFYDEHSKRYHAIPYRDTRRPPMSIWEYRAAKKALHDKGVRVTEDTIFELHTKRIEVVENAKVLTKTARKEQQRRKERARASKQLTKELPKTMNVPPAVTTPVIAGYDPSEIEALPDE